MHYPSEKEILEFFQKLSPEIVADLEPLAKEAQTEYRRARQEDPGNETRLIDSLCRHVAAVFRRRTARLLKKRSGTFDGLRGAIGLDGGEAETAFWCGHRLYQQVERGRMLAVWHRKIQDHLWDLIREAENLWWTPEIVPEGWQLLLGVPPAAEPGTPIPAERKAPASFFESYRANHPNVSYQALATRIGIARDSVFKIKDEKAWVRDYAYQAVAKELGCRAEDLHPRTLPRAPRRGKTHAR